jgi:hypothetical protein
MLSLAILHAAIFAQLLMNEWEQFLGSFGIALVDAVEDARDVAHAHRLCDHCVYGISKDNEDRPH